MEVSILFKIAAIGMVVTILTKVLKASGREEHAFMVGLCGFLIVIVWILPYILQVFEGIQTLMEL